MIPSIVRSLFSIVVGGVITVCGFQGRATEKEDAANALAKKGGIPKRHESAQKDDGQKDDVQKGQKDDGQKGQKDDGQKGQNEDGAKGKVGDDQRSPKDGKAGRKSGGRGKKDGQRDKSPSKKSAE